MTFHIHRQVPLLNHLKQYKSQFQMDHLVGFPTFYSSVLIEKSSSSTTTMNLLIRRSGQWEENSSS